MSMKMTHEDIAVVATVVSEHAPVETVVDRTFRLPPALYVGTVGAYLGFLAIMLVAFGTPALGIPMVVFAFTIIAGFAIPYIWVTMKPDSGQRTIDVGRFQSAGVQTLTGKLTSGEAAVQVLTLPVLIFCWGLAVLVIRSFVSG